LCSYMFGTIYWLTMLRITRASMCNIACIKLKANQSIFMRQQAKIIVHKEED
jgi:hypothetical protein